MAPKIMKKLNKVLVDKVLVDKVLVSVAEVKEVVAVEEVAVEEVAVEDVVKAKRGRKSKKELMASLNMELIVKDKDKNVSNKSQ